LILMPLFVSAALLAEQTATPADESGFVPLFNGEDLAGWETPDPSYWSVEDGAITAKITEDHPCSVNQYLVYEKEELSDFELKLSFRMNGWPTGTCPTLTAVSS